MHFSAFHFSLAVPFSDLVITHDPSGTLYSGISVTLTCTATLNYGVNYDGVAVNIKIAPTRSLQYSITNAVEGPDRYTSSLTINSLTYQHSRFVCHVRVSGEKIQLYYRNSYHYLEIGEFRGTLSFVLVSVLF